LHVFLFSSYNMSNKTREATFSLWPWPPAPGGCFCFSFFLAHLLYFSRALVGVKKVLFGWWPPVVFLIGFSCSPDCELFLVLSLLYCCLVLGDPDRFGLPRPVVGGPPVFGFGWRVLVSWLFCFDSFFAVGVFSFLPRPSPVLRYFPTLVKSLCFNPERFLHVCFLCRFSFDNTAGHYFCPFLPPAYPPLRPPVWASGPSRRVCVEVTPLREKE